MLIFGSVYVCFHFKRGGNAGQPYKWYSQVLKESKRCDECSFRTIFFIHQDLIKPTTKSRVLNHLAFPTASRLSSIPGSGNESLTVLELS